MPLFWNMYYFLTFCAHLRLCDIKLYNDFYKTVLLFFFRNCKEPMSENDKFIYVCASCYMCEALGDGENSESQNN